MRTFKFRYWDGSQMREPYCEPGDLQVANINDELNDCPHLMQYTGLKDANGVEIYENDILGAAVFNTSIVNAQVGFSSGCFILTPLQGERWAEDLCSQNESCSIIGNIYEHPELLEK